MNKNLLVLILEFDEDYVAYLQYNYDQKYYKGTQMLFLSPSGEPEGYNTIKEV